MKNKTRHKNPRVMVTNFLIAGSISQAYSRNSRT